MQFLREHGIVPAARCTNSALSLPDQPQLEVFGQLILSVMGQAARVVQKAVERGVVDARCLGHVERYGPSVLEMPA